MIVNANDRRVDTVASGATATFSFDFAILAITEIAAYWNGTPISSFGVFILSYTGVGSESGGTITFNLTPANGTLVTLIGNATVDQPSRYTTVETLPLTRIENDLSHVVILLQQVYEKLARTPQFFIGSLKHDVHLDDPQSGKFLRYKDADGNIDSATPTPTGSIGLPVSTADGGTGSNYASLSALALALATVMKFPNASAVLFRNFANSGDIQAVSVTTGDDVVLGQIAVTSDTFIFSGGTGDISLQPGGVVSTSDKGMRVGAISGGALTEKLVVVGNSSHEPGSGGAAFTRFLPFTGGKNWRIGTGFITAQRFEIQDTSDSGIAYLDIDPGGVVRIKGAPLQTVVNPTYGATVTIDASLGSIFRITANNGTAFTISSPTNPVTGHSITITVRNTSGGALGAITWGAAYKMSAFTNPANANSRSVTFYYDGTNWIQWSPSGVDVPN